MADGTKTVLELIDKQTTAKLLTDLVNISSPTGEEAEIAKYLADRFEKVGLKAALQEADEGRYNAVGLLEGDGSGLSLMFNGHMDTSFTGSCRRCRRVPTLWSRVTEFTVLERRI